ncbi:response regulator transcription factor [Demequina zhanjiangensis]|uniref:Response regulator transcription factor n=1 Tax=Demequina zhanjiangensis TaxID=3051659 RepID=A0ABT8G0A3_9MICO|nr:response regulator transcription factor [Demequina sp. SYSU T00b26]MDN4472574.1 response regulator transcription factor [Demequina sp. SYSU T00b26]
MTIRVVVVDDQDLIRGGFVAILGTTEDIEVVGEADDGEAAVALISEVRPDVVLMDIRMPGMDGLAATEAIAADPELGDVKVVVLTTFEEEGYVLRALKAGASGFLGKGVRPAELIGAVRTIAEGESLLSPAATRAVIAHVAQDTIQPAADGETFTYLTEREREVVLLVAQGLSNDEIAAQLFITPLTAKTHVVRAMHKVGARDRAQLVVAAYQAGFATP